MARVKANQPCPCGSGALYRVCCRPYDEKNNVIRLTFQQQEPDVPQTAPWEHFEWADEKYRMVAERLSSELSLRFSDAAVIEALRLWHRYSSGERPKVQSTGAVSAAIEALITSKHEPGAFALRDLSVIYETNISGINNWMNKLTGALDPEMIPHYPYTFREMDEDMLEDLEDEQRAGPHEDDVAVQAEMLQEEMEWIWGMQTERMRATMEPQQWSALDRMEPDFNLLEEPLWQAKWLALEALQTLDEHQAARLARKALTFDPDCIDARMILTFFREAETPESRKEVLQDLRVLVQRAYEQIGGDLYARQHQGQYWTLLETRPFMRILFVFGTELHRNQQFGEAAQMFDRLITLNQNDDQNAIPFLIYAKIGAGLYQEADRMLNTYPFGSMIDAFSRVLVHLGKFGRDSKLMPLVKSAHRSNPCVFRIITDQIAGRDTDDTPFDPADFSEAMSYLYFAFPVWATFSDFLFWLDQQPFLKNSK